MRHEAIATREGTDGGLRYAGGARIFALGEAYYALDPGTLDTIMAARF